MRSAPAKYSDIVPLPRPGSRSIGIIRSAAGGQFRLAHLESRFVEKIPHVSVSLLRSIHNAISIDTSALERRAQKRAQNKQADRAQDDRSGRREVVFNRAHIYEYGEITRRGRTSQNRVS